MKKGFTLIELLAVIVILAIIALIATPIILGIINDARKESNERSVELYASAVRNAIASYQLTHPTAPTKFSDLDVQYDGKVECETEELYKDGSFYITNCKVNNVEVEYTHGRKKYEPQYYYFGFDWIGNLGETAAPANPSSVPPTGETHYLGYDVTNGVVSSAYVCFVRIGKEYCLKGNDAEALSINSDILEEAFGEESCSFEDGYSHCSADSLFVSASSYGVVHAYDAKAYCEVFGMGRLHCSEK